MFYFQNVTVCCIGFPYNLIMLWTLKKLRKIGKQNSSNKTT